MCFNRPSEFVGRLILLRGNEADGIFDERVLADVTAEGVAGSVPCGPSCDIVGMQKQTAHRVGFTVRAFRTTATHPDKTDRIGNSLESSRRQQSEGGVCEIPRRLAKSTNNTVACSSPGVGDGGVVSSARWRSTSSRLAR